MHTLQFRPLLFLAFCFGISSCSRARSLARVAEEAGEYKKQVAGQILQIISASKETTWAELLLSGESIPELSAAEQESLAVRLETSKGNITIELAVGLAPMASAVFLRGLQSAYLGTAFPRPPNTPYIVGGKVSVGPFPAEFSEWLQFDRAGVLAMYAPEDGESQGKFLITDSPEPKFFGRYAIFGQVSSGLEVVESLGSDDVITNMTVLEASTFWQQIQDEPDALLARLRTEVLYQRRGLAAIHQKLARDFVAVQWPRRQQEKLQKLGIWGLEYKVLEADALAEKLDLSQGVEIQYAVWATQEDGRTLLLEDRIQKQESVWVSREDLFPAWSVALSAMSAGERRLYVIPPEGAYGVSGYTADIPPWSYLVMELLAY